MPRQRTTEKKFTLGVREGMSGWLEFMGKYSGSMAAYLMDMAEDDRKRVMDEGGELSERYRLYLSAMGYDSELNQVEDELEDRKAARS